MPALLRIALSAAPVQLECTNAGRKTEGISESDVVETIPIIATSPLAVRCMASHSCFTQ
ncbi:MAG: hypothetical protein DDT25_01338 [Chloroflexi bacterium]|nr:hypothetical protein [Chloroflexota bacterium]